MKRFRWLLPVCVLAASGCAHTASVDPIGVRLQKAAGDGYEVIYKPSDGTYVVEQTCQEDDPCWNAHTMGNHRGTK